MYHGKTTMNNLLVGIKNYVPEKRPVVVTTTMKPPTPIGALDGRVRSLGMGQMDLKIDEKSWMIEQVSK